MVRISESFHFRKKNFFPNFFLSLSRWIIHEWRQANSDFFWPALVVYTLTWKLVEINFFIHFQPFFLISKVFQFTLLSPISLLAVLVFFKPSSCCHFRHFLRSPCNGLFLGSAPKWESILFTLTEYALAWELGWVCLCGRVELESWACSHIIPLIEKMHGTLIREAMCLRVDLRSRATFSIKKADSRKLFTTHLGLDKCSLVTLLLNINSHINILMVKLEYKH